MFSFTIIQSAQRDKFANKTIKSLGDLGVSKSDYGNVYWWFFQPQTRHSLGAMVELLRMLARRPEAALIMGAPKPGVDLQRPHVRRWADPVAAENTLIAVDRAWLTVDADDVTLPPGDGRAERLFHAAAHVRDRLLPPEFKWRACVAAPTSMTGLVGDDVGRLRLFFLLDRAYPLAALRRWGRGAQLNDLPVDPAPMLAGQPIYTARPSFIGLDDLVPAELHAFILPGLLDGPVPLEVGQFDEAVQLVTARLYRVSQEVGSDWRGFLDQTIGQHTGFFEPLSKGLGVASRTDATEEEIVAYVAALLAERAADDPGRRARYGERWVRSTVKRFRKADEKVAVQTEQVQARLFKRIS